MSKNVPIPEEVTERKVIVYKPRVDIRAVSKIAEQMKTQLFRRFLFMKPKLEEVKVVSIDKYFEPFVVIDGEYCINYSKNWVHNIQVDDTMQELKLFSEKVLPKTLKGHLEIPCKILQLTGEGRFKMVKKERIIFDKQWREVGLEQLPLLPFEEQPEKVLSKFEPNLEAEKELTSREVEILKSRIARRPEEILLIHNELFKVSERAVIYKPMYQIIFQNIKTRKKMSMAVDAITGNTTSDTHPAVTVRETTKKDEQQSPAISNSAKPSSYVRGSALDHELAK